MVFWIIAGGLAVIVSTLIGLAMRRPRRADAVPAAAYDLQVYRDQLREVEKDLARGLVSEADAERVRAEVSRRILAADTALREEVSGAQSTMGAPRLLAAVAAVLLVGGSLGLYVRLGAPGYGDLALKDRIAMAEDLRQGRPSQETAVAGRPPVQVPGSASTDYITLVEQLRATVIRRPGDLQGQMLLAQSEANLNNFSAAAVAQREVIRIKADTTTASDWADLADLMVLAAGGYVSPEAEAVLEKVLAIDEANGTARYYMGLMLSQTGRPDTAFRIWDALLREGPPTAPWITPVLAQIEDMAFRAGVNYQLPEIGGGRGPTAADIDAAGELSPTERLEMITNMVSGLSDRLSTEGGTVEDWAQLITALGVLGRTGQAEAVYLNAVTVFAEDPRALDVLLRAGRRARVAE